MKIKQWKPVHWMYNLVNYRRLAHNRQAFKKYSIRKPLIGSISSKDFPDKESQAWLDRDDSETLAPRHTQFGEFDEVLQGKIRKWSKEGYLILESLFTGDECDKINDEIDSLLKKGKIKFTHGNKLFFVSKKSKLINEIPTDTRITKVLEFLLDKEVIPFQTLNFITGSQQRAHSDSIHFTTYPLGYLIAVWIALEDITDNSGPLYYYPGSHKLPYLLNNDYNDGETFLKLGKKKYDDYEDVMEDFIADKGFERKNFTAKKGDVLVWNANLIHGGAPILSEGATRKSMVIHYYATDVIKYHEITERPSLI